jgi:hypothetical protein
MPGLLRDQGGGWPCYTRLGEGDESFGDLTDGDVMSILIGCFIVLFCSLVIVTPGALAQPEMTPQTTIRGDLLSIKGEVYLIKDIFGRLVYLRVDKNTKRDRLLVPGEKIEADVVPGQRVLALRLSK